MITRSITLAALAVSLGAAGCSGTESADPSDPTTPEAADNLTAAAENVKQYDDCLSNGHDGRQVALGSLESQSDPGLGAVFSTVECVVSRLNKANGNKIGTFNLRSVKSGPGGQTFILKTLGNGVVSPPPQQQCVKLKLSVAVGPTDAFVTIGRVKRLPPPRADGLCADNGEI